MRWLLLRRRFQWCLAPILIAMVSVFATAQAQEYPARPIVMVVPFQAGGPTDVLARIVAQELARTLGQPVQIENVVGASGTIGAARVARAAPDGYTLMFHHIGLASADTVYKQLPYNTRTAFAPIGLVSKAPMVLIARADFPPDTMPILASFGSAQRAWITMGHGGVGTASHLCALLFQSLIGAQFISVGYRGNGGLLHDVLGGHVDLACETANVVSSAVRAERVKAYVMTGANRLSSLPRLATATETSYGSLDIRLWHGLYAPAGTPPNIVRNLNSALRAALQSQELRQRFAGVNVQPVPEDQVTPQALGVKLIQEIDRWAPLLKAARQPLD